MPIEIEKPEGNSSPDTTQHATPYLLGSYGEKRDVIYVKGKGIFIGKHRLSNMEHDARKIHAQETGKQWDGPYSINIPEATILDWAATVKATNDMKDLRDERLAQYEAGCHPGTDAENPELRSPIPHRKSNDFWVDRSQSTISILTSHTTGQYLNGSLTAHSSYVTIRINSPDGRDICEVAMSFDQLASALVNHMDTPCTLMDYWSINDDCVRLREVVKKPESITKRMNERLEGRLEDADERLTTLINSIQEQIDSGKAMSKTKLIEVLRELDIYRSHHRSAATFTVEQAREEVSSIAEKSAMEVVHQHLGNTGNLPGIRMILETIAQTPKGITQDTSLAVPVSSETDISEPDPS